MFEFASHFVANLNISCIWSGHWFTFVANYYDFLLGNFCESRLISEIYRGSRPQVFCKKGALKNFSQNSLENSCARVSFYKLIGWGLVFSCRVFSFEFCEIWTLFFIEHIWWLLLDLGPTLFHSPWKHHKTSTFLLLACKSLKSDAFRKISDKKILENLSDVCHTTVDR